MNIYLENTSNFENNGLGFLTDVLSAYVTEELNGEYSLNLTYPLNGHLNEYLIQGNIIKCNVGNDNYQLFRIKKVEKNFKTISIYALHIFYDLIDNFIEDSAPTNLSCGAFCEWILSKTNFETNFNVQSDIASTASARYVRRNPVECIMGDIDNSIVNLFGAELERNNFLIKLLSRRGNNNGVKLIFGKNIKEISVSIDITSLYTRIFPLGFDGLKLPEKYVDSPLINNYPTAKITKYEFSDIKYDPEDETAYDNLEDAYAALRNSARELFDAGIDKPQISISIDWLELSKTQEYYNQYSALEKVNLGDTITANILGLDYETRVIKTKYNVLSDMIEQYEVGTPKASLTTSLNSFQKQVEDINPSSILEQAKESATKQITSAMGGYVYKTNNELFIMDTDNPATAQKVWRWNLNGLGYSSTGINGEYGIAMTQDGAIVADFITTGKINTNLIEGYDALLLKVNDIADLTKEISDKTFLEIQDAFEGETLSLSIFGQMSLLYPSDDLYPEDNLYPLDSYLIIEYGDNTQKKIKLPINWLNYFDINTYDEFILEENKAKIIRRVGENEDGSFYKLDNEVIEDCGELIISLKTGYNKLWLESFYDIELNYSCKYVAQNEYTDVFATKVEMDSAINVTKEEIELKVSKKVDGDKVVSAINLSSEEAKIKAPKIGLEGIVTANNNFKVLEDGSIEAVNATLTGDIYLPSGGKVIGGDGMRSLLKFDGNSRSMEFLGSSMFTPIYFSGANHLKDSIEIDFDIPDKFTVTSAFIKLEHIPTINKNDSTSLGTGYCRNLRLYKNSSQTSQSVIINWGYYESKNNSSFSEVSGAFGSSGFTGSSSAYSSTNSVDLKTYIQTGNNIFKIETSDSYNQDELYYRNGSIRATLYVYGYMSE